MQECAEDVVGNSYLTKKQLEYKRQQVEDHVRRIGKCDTPVNDTLPCQQPFLLSKQNGIQL